MRRIGQVFIAEKHLGYRRRGRQPPPLLAKDWLKRSSPNFALMRTADWSRVIHIAHRAIADLPSSRLYLLVIPTWSQRLRVPVHDFIAHSPVDLLRKIKELAAGQFTTLFHGYTPFDWRLNGACVPAQCRITLAALLRQCVPCCPLSFLSSKRDSSASLPQQPKMRRQDAASESDRVDDVDHQA